MDKRNNHQWQRYLPKLTELFWISLSILFYEIVFAIYYRNLPSGYVPLFSIAFGLFFGALAMVPPHPRARIILQGVFTGVVGFIYIAQVVYHRIFGTLFIVNSLQGADDAMYFADVLFISIFKSLPIIALFFVPMVVFFIVARKYIRRSKHTAVSVVAAICTAIIITVFTTGLVVFDNSGAVSPRRLYLSEFSDELASRRFGLLQTMTLDLRFNVLKIQFTIEEEVVLDDIVVEESFASPSTEINPSETVNASSTASEPLETTIPTETEPEPIVYEPNILNITFPADETDTTLADMNAYFSAKEPSMQNEYSGLFEGKNLILITAEGFSKYVIDPELTPTLYMMANEGFVFNNFYTPVWGVSTSDGEYVATTGLIPKSGVWSYSYISDNEMPFAFGNQFAAKGYISKAYHNHTYTYYNRHKSYPTMGYDYKGIGNGLDVKKTWPESDLEMIQVTGPEFIGNQPFHVYFMTVSGHLRYSFSGNFIAAQNKALVEQLDKSSAVKAYYACQMELDFAMAELIRQLDNAGQLENTVIAISSDHYPYGLEEEQYNELAGHDLEKTFEMYENSFILWSASMPSPIVVDTYCSSLDIAPTLSNLFGLPYDSRLYAGTDILSDSEKYVVFKDRSFINGSFMYDAGAKKVIKLVDEDLTEDHLKEAIEHVNDMFKYSSKIIEKDYYGYILTEDWRNQQT